MEKIIINYKHGKTTFTGSGVITAPMVNQALEKAHGVLQQQLGEYTWTLEGYSGKYSIIASYSLRGKREQFTESTGKTPKEALRNWIPGRLALESLGVNLR